MRTKLLFEDTVSQQRANELMSDKKDSTVMHEDAENIEPGSPGHISKTPKERVSSLRRPRSNLQQQPATLHSKITAPSKIEIVTGTAEKVQMVNLTIVPNSESDAAYISIRDPDRSPPPLSSNQNARARRASASLTPKNHSIQSKVIQ